MRVRHPAWIVLAVAVACSAALALILTSDIIFLRDEWTMVLDRRGVSLDTLFDPHAGHLAVAVVVFYKLLLQLFGMGSPLPYHVGSTLIYLLAAVLLFAYLRRRVGDWLALFGAIVILFFGAAAFDLLSPFQMFFSASIAAGLGALLALDRDDRIGDAFACLLLVVSISPSETGLAFCAGAAVTIALGDRPRLSRAYIVLVPLVLYALWWLGWGHTVPSEFSWGNVAGAPRYVLTAIGTALGAMLGINSAIDQVPEAVGQRWVPVVLVAAAALGAWRLVRLGRIPPGLWTPLAIGFTFWVLAALNYVPDYREPGNGRYLYPSAVFLLLIAAELLRGVRLSRPALIAAAAVTALAVAGNMAFLSDSYSIFLKNSDELERGAVTGLEFDAHLNPNFVLNADVSPVTFYDIGATPYLSAVESFGSPAYTEEELLGAGEDSRAEADRVSAAMLGLTLTSRKPRKQLPAGTRSGAAISNGCAVVRASPSGVTGVRLRSGEVSVGGAGSPVTIGLARFSEQLPVNAGTLEPGQTAAVTIPDDGVGQPWRLGLIGEGTVDVCVRRGPASSAAEPGA